MAKKYHMKLDQSGAGICEASERECPNGAFGHFGSEYEVMLSYERSIENGEVGGLSTIVTLRNDEIKEQRKTMADEINSSKTDESYIEAVTFNLHPLDGAQQLKLLKAHTSSSPKDVAIREHIAKFSQLPKVLEQIAETEDNNYVYLTLAGNKALESDEIMTRRFAELNMSANDATFAKKLLAKKKYKAKIDSREDREYARRQEARNAKSSASENDQRLLQQQKLVQQTQIRRENKEQSTRSEQSQPTQNRTSKSSDSGERKQNRQTLNRPENATKSTGGRTVSEITSKLTEVAKNFQQVAGGVDSTLATLSQKLKIASAKDDNPKRANAMKEVAEALSKRSYGRGFLTGGLNGKPAVDLMTISLEKEIPEGQRKYTLEKIFENLKAQGMPSEVSYEAKRIKVSFMDQAERDALDKAKKFEI